MCCQELLGTLLRLQGTVVYLLNSLLPRTATDTDSQRPHRNCPLANNVEYVEHEARCDLCVVRSCRGRYCACRVRWTTC